MITFPKHLLSAQDLSQQHILLILKLAQKYTLAQHSNKLNNLTQINLFFETSTRTRISFEIAGQRLGANVLSIASDSSAIKKGETLLDTALTLNAMKPNVLVVRHNLSGAVNLLAQKVDCPVINAGDGAHQHPTQALIDALTIQRRYQSISGLNVAICGDILHSRVARSNIHILKTLGANVRLIAPSTLLPPNAASAFGVQTFHHLDDGLPGCDIVMVLRLQEERMLSQYIASPNEYFQLWGLTTQKLQTTGKNTLVMHPGPINRGVEIDSAVADNPQYSLIQEQVEMGVAIRMAILDILTRKQQAHQKIPPQTAEQSTGQPTK